MTKEDERRKRFEVVATRRTREVLKYLRRLRNCANRNRYCYTDEQVDKITQAIDADLTMLKEKFKKKEHGAPENQFSL